MKTDHILIIRFSAMGDVAMVVPVVYELALQYPEVRITVLSQPFARPFFEFLAPRVGFMDADLKNEYQGVVGLNTLYRRLTAKNFTAIADFHDVLRTKWLRTRFNIDQYRVEHINKHRMQKRRLTAHKHKVFKQLPSSFDNYADVLSRLGYPIDLGRFHSIFGEGHGNLRLLPLQIGEKKPFQQWIGVAPFASHTGKTYPLPLLKEAIEMMIKRHPSCRIFLFGGKERRIASARAAGLASLLSTHRSYPVLGYRYWSDASAEPTHRSPRPASRRRSVSTSQRTSTVFI